jgi:hypothetical protein
MEVVCALPDEYGTSSTRSREGFLETACKSSRSEGTEIVSVRPNNVVESGNGLIVWSCGRASLPVDRNALVLLVISGR